MFRKFLQTLTLTSCIAVISLMMPETTVAQSPEEQQCEDKCLDKYPEIARERYEQICQFRCRIK